MTMIQDDFLGNPQNEDEWLHYEGRCILFVGDKKKYNKNTNEDEWILETDEIIQNKLKMGLDKYGVQIKSIEYEWTNTYEGTVSCVCSCFYNKPYQVYFSEFFIQGLTSFELEKDNPNSVLEFYFSKRIHEK